MLKQLFFTIAVQAALLQGATAAELELRMVKDDSGKPVAFEVAGLTDDESAALARLPAGDDAWGRILSVYVAGSNARGDLPPLIGSYELSATTLRFIPKYALKPGLRYKVRFQPGAVSKPQATEFPGNRQVVVYVTAPAAERGDPTKVVAIYPSADTLPENQLRFYLHFSAPMARGEVYQRVRLLDESGKPVAHPFLEIGEELWDQTGTRLTLLIDPGRIKRGLRPREEDGPVLEAGKKYRLVIDRRWRDASGHQLAESFEKRFAAGSPIEQALDASKWKIEPPAAASKKPLVVRFPAPLDHALLERTIAVESSGGMAIGGQITITDEEKTWQFTPDEPWRAGEHELVVDATLEDVAGNRIGVPFEVDQAGPIEKRVEAKVFRLPLVIGD